MDLSMRWLGDYIDVSDMPIKEFCSGLTISGSKVERWETEGEEISKVVVGKILSVVPHENSDHLVVCKVDVGHASPDVLQIVTGASNVHEGDIVPVAMLQGYPAQNLPPGRSTWAVQRTHTVTVKYTSGLTAPSWKR